MRIKLVLVLSYDFSLFCIGLLLCVSIFLGLALDLDFSLLGSFFGGFLGLFITKNSLFLVIFTSNNDLLNMISTLLELGWFSLSCCLVVFVIFGTGEFLCFFVISQLSNSSF